MLLFIIQIIAKVQYSRNQNDAQSYLSYSTQQSVNTASEGSDNVYKHSIIKL